MKNAFLLIIAAQCLWTMWSSWVSQSAVGDVEYFWSMFVAAALVDYYCIQVLTAMKWTNKAYKYFQALVALLSASLGLHLVGCIGYLGSSTFLLQLYDTTSVFLLIAELGVFIAYGSNIVRNRGVVRSRAGN